MSEPVALPWIVYEPQTSRADAVASTLIAAGVPDTAAKAGALGEVVMLTLDQANDVRGEGLEIMLVTGMVYGRVARAEARADHVEHMERESRKLFREALTEIRKAQGVDVLSAEPWPEEE